MIYKNVVENIIVGESLDDIKNLFPNLTVVEQTLENESVSIGWTYDGVSFAQPIVEETPEDPA
jgi:hypothetical protein